MEIAELPEKSFYLASYPRSGNTWMMYSLSMLFSAIRGEARSSFDLYPFCYETSGEFYFRAESEIDSSRPLIIKTHEAHDIYKEIYPARKSIYVYRDGRDVLLSYYFFKKMFASPGDIVLERVGRRHDLASRTAKPVEFDAKEFSVFLRSHSSEWISHVVGWLEDRNIFAVRYEGLHDDFSAILAEIVQYLDIDPVVSIESVYQTYVEEFRKYFANSNRNFFRKGVTGDWRNYFTDEHVTIFFEMTGDLLGSIGYK